MEENKLYLSYEDVERYVQDIARQLTTEGWTPHYIVGLTRGGLLPANLLSQYLDVPMYALHVSLRDNQSDMGPESNTWMAEDALNGKKILVVDDINDSGATLEWIVNDWKCSARPKSPEWKRVFCANVRFAACVNNEASDFKNIGYTGLEINKLENDVWVVFPWEDWWTAKPK